MLKRLKFLAALIIAIIITGCVTDSKTEEISSIEAATPSIIEESVQSGESSTEDMPASEATVLISGNKSELHSAMSNLLSNAVRYTPAGGSIRAGWRMRTDGWSEFFVEDSGPGIAAEHLPRLTERFYRVDRSRSRETGGTGLGLAIVKHVAQRHGGKIEVKSTIGQGSTFSIVLTPSRVQQIKPA